MYGEWSDLKRMLDVLPPGNGVEYRLRSCGLKFVYTGLENGTAGSYLRQECDTCGIRLNQKSYEATTLPLGDSMRESEVKLSGTFLNMIQANGDRGVLMVEGASSFASLHLDVVRSATDELIASASLPLILSSVEDMFERVNIRNGAAVVTTGYAMPPDNGKHVIFLHGLRVNPLMARAWWSEVYKKLWMSGSNARFHGVTWLADDGFPINGIDILDEGAFKYHVNVIHAFDAAHHLSDFVNGIGAAKGDIVVMAHSLGNMVVSSAIADHNMRAGSYFMLNAAVASEAFDDSQWNDSPAAANVMVHEDWRDYPSVCWSANWHEFFRGSPSDDRRLLTWKDRFAGVLANAAVYNFYSSGDSPTASDGDEVFELYDGTPATLGNLSDPGRYSWHLQETHKGRFGLLDVAATSWAGLGFGNPYYEVLERDPSSGQMLKNIHYYYPDAAAAVAAPPDRLRDIPVFRSVPSSMFSSSIKFAERNSILAKGIPALSPAAGKTAIFDENHAFNMNTTGKPDGGAWARDDSHMYKKRWLHNDMENMAFFFTHKLFNKLVKEGDLE